MDRSIDGPAEFVHTNVLGTFQLLDSARRYWRELPEPQRSEFRFLHVSTDEVYGSLGPTGRFIESSPYDPSSPYSASKAAADHLARAYHRTYGLPVLVTNCSNNYGPYQFPEKLIPLMILNAVEGKPLPVYGDGQNVRDWLFRRGSLPGAVGACSPRARPARPTTSAATASRRISTSCGRSARSSTSCVPGLPHAPCASLITFVKDRPGHDRRYAIDATKIAASWAGGRSTISSPACGGPSTGIWTIPAGSQRVSSGAYQRERLGLMRKRNATMNDERLCAKESSWPAAPARGCIRSPGRSASNSCRSTTSR